MTVKELKDILNQCDDDIQVVIIDKYIKGITSVKQVTLVSLHDEPDYPDCVEIRVGI